MDVRKGDWGGRNHGDEWTVRRTEEKKTGADWELNGHTDGCKNEDWGRLLTGN